MDLELAGKIVLITGSSRGIGKAIAHAFPREGARVVITGRNGPDVQRLVETIRRDEGEDRAMGYEGDLTQPKIINGCVQRVIEKWGRIDILVCNMGSGKGERTWALPDTVWDESMGLNFWAAVRVSQTVLPHLLRTARSSIVYISSIAGVESVGAPIPYEVAKSGLLSYAKALSNHVAAQGVRVNVVAPGNILFPGSPWEEKLRADEDATRSMIHKTVPMNRFGKPDEVADSVVFLASPRASFITGTCVIVDGGQSRSFR